MHDVPSMSSPDAQRALSGSPTAYHGAKSMTMTCTCDRLIDVGLCRRWPCAQRCARLSTSLLVATTLRRVWAWAVLARNSGVQSLLRG